MSTWSRSGSSTEEVYLLLADLSGYTSFLAGVERLHGVDFSAGVPVGFGVLAALLDTVVEGVRLDFEINQLEGDAVFAVAAAVPLDGRGDDLVGRLRAVHAAFVVRREEAARAARDHICTACPAVSSVDLKMVLHRGQVVRQTVGPRNELMGATVNVAHRLLKNTVSSRIGYRPYLFLTDPAAAALGIADIGLAHREEYPDVGSVPGRIVTLAEA